MRKAQIQQVFLYLLAAILIGVIALFGYKSINNIMKHGCEAEKIRFLQQLQEIGENNHQYGIKKVIKITPPCNYEWLCIINNTNTRVAEELEGNPPGTLKTAWENNVAQNIFISKGGETPQQLEAIGISEYLATPKGYVCIKAKGGLFELNIEGNGKYAIIK